MDKRILFSNTYIIFMKTDHELGLLKSVSKISNVPNTCRLPSPTVMQ
jgi:hypothetical protein